MRAPWLVLLMGCQSDISFTEGARCDGVLQPGEASVDAPFDADDDGFVDGTNRECRQAYDAADLDCNDDDPLMNPVAAEACNGLDDDCDGEADEDCVTESYAGVYTVSPAVTYSCAAGLVQIAFATVTVFDSNPTLAISAGNQPGTMTGTVDSAGAFTVTNSISGSCTENYRMIGAFSDATHFETTFETYFVGMCLSCQARSWSITGTRNP